MAFQKAIVSHSEYAYLYDFGRIYSLGLFESLEVSNRTIVRQKRPLEMPSRLLLFYFSA